MDSIWSPCEVHMDHRLHRLHLSNRRLFLNGLHVDSMDSTQAYLIEDYF
jgi:hypothetical protein